MSAAPNLPPRHNRRLRDHEKLARGKKWFTTLAASPAILKDLSDLDLADALYYASNSVTGASGTRDIKKAIRAEAKKRGLRVA